MTADTATTAAGLEDAPTSHPRLLAWVASVAELAQPERVHWCDGSDAEWSALTDALVEAGTLVRLDDAKKPNSYWARTDPSDVARVEERTFICSVEEADAGPTNNWMDPAQMKATMTELYRGRATTRSTSCSFRRSGPSGPTAPGTAATPCSARSATACGSPR